MTKATADRHTEGLNEAFPHKICINLDRRPDRWQRMQLKFHNLGIHEVQRFAALDGERLQVPSSWIHTPGAYGCLLSHLQVVSDARRLGKPNVLIFEDDAVFDTGLHEKFATYVEQLPRDWDMLFFGALHKDEPINVSANIARISKANSTYAYALRETVYDDFIELNRRAETVLDHNTFVLQEKFNCYCFTPNLAWVETDYSDAQNRLEHHWYLEESLVLFGSHVDRLLSDTTVVFAYGAHAESGRATENLLFLVRYYHEFFSSYIEIVIVEQGNRPTLDRARLPRDCKYLFFEDAGPFDRERCFKKWINSSNSKRRFWILSDSDLYLETLDIRANLIMCERYGYSTGFGKVIELTIADSERLRDSNSTRGIDVLKDAVEPDSARPCYCRFISREAVPAQDEANAHQMDTLLSLSALKHDRIFRSPNRALRLR